MRWRSGWWPSSSAIALTAFKNPMAAAQFLATHSRPGVPPGVTQDVRHIRGWYAYGVAHQLPVPQAHCAAGRYVQPVRTVLRLRHVSAQLPTDHGLVIGESPLWDGRQSVM